MPTVRLIPSTLYNAAGTSYLTVADASNCYANTDNTSYATITNTNASTSSRYVYIRGFNFGSIPSDAIVTSFTVKFKARESGITTSTSYRPMLCNNTTTITGTASMPSTTASVITFTSVTAEWATISGYGSNFGIRVNCRRSSKNTTGYMYIYGAEIEVTYKTLYSITISNSTSATVTASNSTPYEGDDVEIRSNTISGLTITDNGVDVTSQFTVRQDSGSSYDVVNVGTYGFALNSGTGYYTSNNKGISKSAAVCRVDFHVPVAASITFTYINYAEATYDFGVFGNIDVALSNNYYAAGSSGATITDSSYKKACNTSADNTASAQTLTYTMSAGDHSIWVKYSKDDASDANNDTLQFKVAITLTEPFTPGTYYGYDITNISGNHTIVVTQNSSTPPTITVGTPSRSIISDESGYDQCTCTFQSDVALQAWEARATKAGVTPGRGVGLLVESGTTLAAYTNATVIVDDEELTGGDGEYTITVYGQSTGGVWSG